MAKRQMVSDIGFGGKPLNINIEIPCRDELRPYVRAAALAAVKLARYETGGTVTYSVCTINQAENEAVVDASGLEPEPLGDEWPAFRHPRRSDFLLTLPHVHRTSGFFIARLRVP